MRPDQIQNAANALFAAEKSRQQIGLISMDHPEMSMDDAYEVQSAYVDRKLSNGGKQRGWKIGLTSKAMQSALGIDIPDSGILFEDMFFENGSQIPQDRFIQPRIEAEIAFVMKAPISGPNTTGEQVLAATDFVCPSLEILDTRILRQDPKTGTSRKIFDTIADNAANAGVVLGAQKHKINAFDLRWVGAIIAKNDEVEETGLGAGVLNDPVMGIVWLADRLAQYNQSISAGDVVLSGSFIRPVETQFGDHIHADFGPFGHVSCTF